MAKGQVKKRTNVRNINMAKWQVNKRTKGKWNRVMRSWDGEPKEKWTRVIETILKMIMDHPYHQDNRHSFHHHHYDHSHKYDQYSYPHNPHLQVMRAEGAGGKWNRVMKRQGEVVSFKIIFNNINIVIIIVTITILNILIN